MFAAFVYDTFVKNPGFSQFLNILKNNFTFNYGVYFILIESST